jgi:hypothetical protein
MPNYRIIFTPTGGAINFDLICGTIKYVVFITTICLEDNNMFFGWQGIATLVGILVVVSLILYVFSKWLDNN